MLLPICPSITHELMDQSPPNFDLTSVPTLDGSILQIQEGGDIHVWYNLTNILRRWMEEHRCDERVLHQFVTIPFRGPPMSALRNGEKTFRDTPLGPSKKLSSHKYDPTNQPPTLGVNQTPKPGQITGAKSLCYKKCPSQKRLLNFCSLEWGLAIK